LWFFVLEDNIMLKQKELVMELRKLAQHPNHQAALMENDQCLTSLQQYLITSQDIDILLITIEILHICAQTPKNRPKLGAVPNLSDTLYVLSTENQDPKVRTKASELHSEISLEDDLDLDGSLELEEADTASRVSQVSQNSRYTTKQLYRVHLIVVNVKTAEQRDKFFTDAVRNPRVVSATMDSQLRNATLYTTHRDIKDELIKHLTRKGYEILSKDVGYRYRPVLEDSEKEDIDYDMKAPAYLDKADIDSRKRDYSYALGHYRPNHETETLTSRLNRFKQEQEESKEKETSLLSSVVKWFW